MPVGRSSGGRPTARSISRDSSRGQPKLSRQSYPVIPPQDSSQLASSLTRLVRLNDSALPVDQGGPPGQTSTKCGQKDEISWVDPPIAVGFIQREEDGEGAGKDRP